MFLSSLACSGLSFAAPTATPTATSTPTFTATSTATETPTVTLTPTRTITPTVSYLDWPVEFSDTFDDEYGGWPTGKTNDEYTTADIEITGGKFLLKVTAKKPFIWRFKPEVENLTDFFLAAEVKKIKSPDQSDCGIIFRSSQLNYYYYFINLTTRKYGVALYYDSDWEDIIKWTRSELIDSTGSNRLAVLGQGSQFTLFINGEEVDSFEDDTLDMGKVGIAIELYKAGDYLELEFDNFDVTAPKKNR